jgi:hypothetical protein
VAGCSELNNYPSVSIKCVEFLDCLRNCWPVKKAYPPGVIWLISRSCAAGKGGEAVCRSAPGQFH